jgi:hypothetical protein
MEFSPKDIIGLLANKETVVVGFALIFLALFLLERRDRQKSDAKLEKAREDNIESHKALTETVKRFDENTTFWRDTIMRLTDQVVRLREERFRK